MVVIDERETHVSRFTLYTSHCRYILEHTVLLVMQQEHTTVKADRKVCETVIVVIPSGASNAVEARVKARLHRHIFEPAAEIVVKRNAPSSAIVGQKDVGTAIAVVVEEASAWGEEGSQAIAP